MEEEFSKVFSFAHKNSSAAIYLSGSNYEEVLQDLDALVKEPELWRCDDPEGVEDE